MHRIILQFAGLTITSWGVMLVIAFLIGIWVAERRAKKYNISPSLIADLSVILIIAAIVGGRIEFIIENYSQYADNPGDIFKVWEGGLIFYGGFVLAIVCGIIFMKAKKISISDGLNLFAPSIALGLFFARIGCFLNGCCFGKETTSCLGVVFPADSPAGWVFKGETAVLPTQLFESLAGLAMFGILLLIEKKKKKLNYGYLFWALLLMYSVWRFFIDFFRYYEQQAYIIGNLTHNQIVSIIIFIVSLAVILKSELSQRHS